MTDEIPHLGTSVNQVGHRVFLAFIEVRRADQEAVHLHIILVCELESLGRRHWNRREALVVECGQRERLRSVFGKLKDLGGPTSRSHTEST